MSKARYDVDKIRESMVRIFDNDGKTTKGSGFIISADAYLITCHHVIYQLECLQVEYNGQRYDAQWCEASREDVVFIGSILWSFFGGNDKISFKFSRKLA